MRVLTEDFSFLIVVFSGVITYHLFLNAITLEESKSCSIKEVLPGQPQGPSSLRKITCFHDASVIH